MIILPPAPLREAIAAHCNVPVGTITIEHMARPGFLSLQESVARSIHAYENALQSNEGKRENG